ncbi:hypothetical protein F5Y11DRAFT_232724 [Daldinia sp. FL1419]|nr:hypothetical protein F5Y11DRAFT_232724 [Daldinia sp. FL1419]
MNVPQPESRTIQDGTLTVDPNLLLSSNLQRDINQPRSKRDLWEASLLELEKYNPKAASTLRADINTRPGGPDIVNSVLRQASQIYEKYRQKRADQYEGRKRHIGSDKIHKMINSVMRFKGLVDAGLKLDPSGYGTIAWTAVSFFFQMAINHKDKADFVLEGAEFLTHLLARYALIEVQYMAILSSALDQLETCVIRVYEAILEYLAEMKSFQTQTKLGRFHPFLR